MCAGWCTWQNGSTPLLAAVKGSYDAIVKGLLEKRADVNAMAMVRVCHSVCCDCALAGVGLCVR